ncbi:uncharacterized protein ColSpa_04612 [Colletotrichum spaethianum]|uniref:Uncharacterized protein n=1 Tax=Colletotrichum spaethianum TaxID=700344 RepID=A0AA37L9R4_9PEZI|nr:uncharacterized protein ColSpa_04612 [Colletotrichum spaethianum]GKT44431.1 hypothetical protein ColSpa_04612 [Colletotrichum spaethianum]
MVNLSLLVTATLAVSAEAVSYTWTKCLNVDKCLSVGAPGDPTGQKGKVFRGKAGAASFWYPGTYLFPYSATTGFTYDQGDGYWYSHDADGLYISPQGYVNFAHDYNKIGINSKDQDIGSTYWVHGGAPCCLPDEVGVNIYDVVAYQHSA